MTPSAEYPDKDVLPYYAILLDWGCIVLLKFVARLCCLSW